MVRNFYIKGFIDGRKTDIAGGSGNKNGGMRLLLTQRSNGEITTCLTIDCRANGSDLVTSVYDASGNLIFTNKTKR